MQRLRVLKLPTMTLEKKAYLARGVTGLNESGSGARLRGPGNRRYALHPEPCGADP